MATKKEKELRLKKIEELAKIGTPLKEISELTGLSYPRVRGYLSGKGISNKDYYQVEAVRKCILLPIPEYEKLTKLCNNKPSSFVTELIRNNQEHFDMLDLELYRIEFNKAKEKKRIDVTIKREDYYKALNIRFKEEIDFTFLVWFLIKTYYIK